MLPMHSNVTIKNVSWPHFSWATLYKLLLFVTVNVVKYLLRCILHPVYCLLNAGIIIIYYYYYYLTPVLNSQGRKIMLCKDKIQKQAGMVFTPSPPSQNYQEVE